MNEVILNAKIIAFDFDGTVCEDCYPEIGQEKRDIIEMLWFTNAKLILWTCRTGELLENAVKWLNERGIYPDAVNDNLEEIKLQGLLSRKVYADVYLDDKGVRV